MVMKKELYLILDCSIGFELLFSQAKQALEGDADKIQLFNADRLTNLEIEQLLKVCHHNQALLLINQDFDFAILNNCDGVHFDELPDCWNSDKVPISFLVGLTVGNEENTIKKAIENSVDYISFCSLYPTKSATNCEIIDQQNIIKASEKFTIPIYVAGGITPEHLDEIKDWPIAGIAMITGITEAENITARVKEIKKRLNL